MARPLRIEFPGALYHVTARGDRQEPIFIDDSDRRALLTVIDDAMSRLDAEAISFCLMGNHYHIVIRTRQPNLSRLMRQINGEYTRAFNRRHGVTGHVFQGRYHAVLVDRDAYLIEVCRYVELNPVRAGLVTFAADWAWSSYRAHIGLHAGYAWLATATLHGLLLGRDASTADDRQRAEEIYATTVADALGAPSWRESLRNDIFLGGESFVAETQALATSQRLRDKEINKVQRTEGGRLDAWLCPSRSRRESFRMAYSQGGMTMSDIASQAGLTVSRVSQLIAEAERPQDSRPDTAKLKT